MNRSGFSQEGKSRAFRAVAAPSGRPRPALRGPDAQLLPATEVPCMTREQAHALDLADPLARFRDAFALPGGVFYLAGTSLGPPPLSAHERLERTSRREWGEGLVRSWNAAAWIEAPLRVGGKIARLIGAKPGEVTVA